MMGNPLVSAMASALSNLGIPLQVGAGTDISVRTVFLDAGWSSGDKKIEYEALIFANESEQTVFLYEKTVETGSGFSFGNDSGSTFQSGATLYRKVKSVQYGPDGKAFEYTLDLGAIPKAVKQTAKQFGWSFKTVIRREKALYPAGYAPAPAVWGFCMECGKPLTADARFCPSCGKATQRR